MEIAVNITSAFPAPRLTNKKTAEGRLVIENEIQTQSLIYIIRFNMSSFNFSSSTTLCIG